MANKPGPMEELVNQSYFESAYRNKKVFITGHTGFKGSWLSCILNQCGAIVKGYALQPETEPNLYSIVWNDGFETVIDDIRNKKRLKDEIISFQPDYIFHLAAQALVRRSYEIPAETFEVNAVGTANLLEAVQQLEKKCVVVIVTTDKVYENKEADILYTEDDRLGGYDPYSASKACTELVVSSFRNSFFNKVHYNKHQKSIISVRAGNVIGGGDWSKDRLVPDIVRSLAAGMPIEVRNPSSVRPWQHVLEPLSGYLLVAASIMNKPFDFSDAYNFGPAAGDHLTVKQLVERAIHSWGEGNWKDVSDASQPHEAKLLMLDISRAQNELGWKPKLNSDLSVKWSVEWYRQPLNKAAEYTYKQISDYLNL
jgi:CDP-glucose 4,6-dehydratase